MAISEKMILDPEASKPGIPTRRSTIAGLAILLLVLGLVSSFLLSAGTYDAAGQTAVAKDSGELKQVGSSQAIKDEEAAASRKAASAPAARPDGPDSATVVSRPTASRELPLPPDVRRDNNVGALYDRRLPGAPASASPTALPPVPPPAVGSPYRGDIEQDAATRIAKSVVVDVDEPKPGAGQPGAVKNVAVDGSSPLPQAPQLPSHSINADLERLKAQALGAAAIPQGHKGWLKEYGKDAAEKRVITGRSGANRLLLHQGKVIPAVLGRQVVSDLPGRITASVSSNVYDTGGQLLIPMGSVLVGKYNSDVHVGQSRVMFGFERLILPNGYSFDLPAAPGSDLAGAAGMTGAVDNHFFKMFGSSLLIALLADSTRQPASVTNINSGGASTAAGQVLTDVSRTVLERNRAIAPTITVEPGTRINVEVVADMVFPDAYRTILETRR